MSEPDKPIRIFISCIQCEIKKERELLEKEVFPALIERFSKLLFYWSESAAVEEDFTLNLTRIDECDLFIAVVGQRYGETVHFFDRRLQFEISDYSQLEIEVRYALYLSKPIQIYYINLSLAPPDRANNSEGARMVRFQRELDKRIGEFVPFAPDHPVRSCGGLGELCDFVAHDLADFIEARRSSKQRPVYLDENVQFTVYRPRTIEPEQWYPLLAFAHLSERRSDAPDEPDPLQEMQRQAETLLGAALPNYQDLTEDSRFAVPREHELVFLPTIPQIAFNPPSRAFLWTTESVHREEFRMKTSARPGEVLRGSMTVFLGSIILAEINLVVRVSAGGATKLAQPESVSSRPYHKIFASYSRRDTHIVEEFERYVGALGHGYLRDVLDLRSGEVWNARLLQMIDQADVFQLFWSSNSMRSSFVRQEWEYALTLSRPFFVRPVYWEEPFPELPAEGLPPDRLRRLEFTRLRSRETDNLVRELPVVAPCAPTRISPPLPKKLDLPHTRIFVLPLAVILIFLGVAYFVTLKRDRKLQSVPDLVKFHDPATSNTTVGAHRIAAPRVGRAAPRTEASPTLEDMIENIGDSRIGASIRDLTPLTSGANIRRIRDATLRDPTRIGAVAIETYGASAGGGLGGGGGGTPLGAAPREVCVAIHKNYDRLSEAYAKKDLQAIKAIYAPDYLEVDRSAVINAETALSNKQALFEMEVSPTIAFNVEKLVMIRPNIVRVTVESEETVGSVRVIESAYDTWKYMDDQWRLTRKHRSIRSNNQ